MLTKSMACLAKATNIAKMAVRAIEDTNDALSGFLVSLSVVALRLLGKHFRACALYISDAADATDSV